MLGLKRGTVVLCEHQKEWEFEAVNTIARIKNILGPVICDIQHVGSTAIKTIKAKPIIDIAVAVDSFDDVLKYEEQLKDAGYYYRPNSGLREQLLFASGSLYNGTGDEQTHFIHIVKSGSMDWINYINFRNYLNNNPDIAKQYEDLKVSLAVNAPIDNGREKYLKGKHDFIVYTLRKALVNSYLGKTVNIKIDRPIGYVHKKEKYSLTYPINYGYIPGVLGGDGEELDVYLLGVNEPVSEYRAKIIGITHRENDVEDKLIAAPDGMNFTKEEIEMIISFQEQYYNTYVEVLKGTHNMKLWCDAFNHIADGSKTIELRLNDEKRQQICIGDTIIFNCTKNNDIITAKVKALHKFDDFKELYENLPLDKCGYSAEELKSAHYTDMEQYYTKEQIAKYGVLGIELYKITAICDVKSILDKEDIYNLLRPSVYNPTPEKLLNRAKKYQVNDKTRVFAYSQNGKNLGIIVFEVTSEAATILDIAVNLDVQCKGVGSKMIDFILKQFNVKEIIAETDDDAINFYKKYGFNIKSIQTKFDTKRYICTFERKFMF